ncbi:hypothetical protein [Streptomyces sp. NPDC001508]|uniref:hypothetical protein n=1 Tax=Streptomyces sp. NPDC001508 TaxID=3154656 RepID=UPI003326EFD1
MYARELVGVLGQELDPRGVAYYQSTHADAAALDGNHNTATRALNASQTQIERTASAPPPQDRRTAPRTSVGPSL